MKKVAIVIIPLLLIIACTKKPTDPPGNGVSLANPQCAFAVFSDPHYFDPDLGTSGDAFEAEVATDRKMLAESDAIFRAILDILGSQDLDFVLIPGDLTKDGEKSGHEKVADMLRQLEQTGKQIYVVPGNHDINNVYAERYDGTTSTPVPTVTPAEFETLYSAFGFDEALYRDSESLTYIVEPVDGLWLFCMDACRYRENDGTVIPGGRFQPRTLQWIKDMLIEAKILGKMVFGMMHHGLMEHFNVQEDYFPDFVVEEWAPISTDFAGLGMRIVFTGHFHAQDIVSKTASSAFMVDIETGSTVTYPCPYRLLDMADYSLEVTSHLITTINYDLGGRDLQEYASDFLLNGLLDVALAYAGNYGISADDVQEYGPVVMQTALDHFAGDETWSPEALAFRDELNNRGDAYSVLAAQALESIYNDPPPADNDIKIDLRTGAVSSPALSAR